MTGKVEIVKQLGEQALPLPGFLADAPAANERLKARLSLLQGVAAHARRPARAPMSPEAEQRAGGLDDLRFDQTVPGARARTDGWVLVPGAGALPAGVSGNPGVTPAPASPCVAIPPAALQSITSTFYSVRRAKTRSRGTACRATPPHWRHGCLSILQTRTARRSPRAALRIAADLVHEDRIDIDSALERIADIDLTLAADGEPVILLRPEISASYMPGISAACGMFTSAGGRTAHAAVLARHPGKTCLAACRAFLIDPQRREATLASRPVHEDDGICLDGQTGEISPGRRAIVNEPPPELAELERWHAPPRQHQRSRHEA